MTLWLTDPERTKYQPIRVGHLTIWATREKADNFMNTLLQATKLAATAAWISADKDSGAVLMIRGRVVGCWHRVRGVGISRVYHVDLGESFHMSI